MRINGKEVKATEFFFDGCHKIYVADSDEGYRQMYAAGWDDGDKHPITELPAIWAASCPLRFINSADLQRSFVRQCEPAEFEGWLIPDDLEREIKVMGIEQMQANGEITDEEYAELMERWW